MNRKAANQKGIALVLVLWMLVVLSILTTSLAGMQRNEIVLTHHMKAQAQTNALAEAGIFYAIWRLSHPQAASSPGNANIEHIIDEHTVNISIRDESGKISLNSAPGSLFENLLSKYDVSPEQREKVVAAIQDWRDPDHQTRYNGAEDAEYVALGASYNAKDGPFNSVEELQLIHGMTDAIYKILAAHSTVNSYQPGLNSQAVSLDALQALPNMSEQLAAEIISSRENGTLNELINTLPQETKKYLTTTSNGIYSISSNVMVSNVNTHIEAVVHINAKAEVPYSILSWSHQPIETIKQ